MLKENKLYWIFKWKDEEGKPQELGDSELCKIIKITDKEIIINIYVSPTIRKDWGGGQLIEKEKKILKDSITYYNELLGFDSGKYCGPHLGRMGNVD